MTRIAHDLATPGPDGNDRPSDPQSGGTGGEQAIDELDKIIIDGTTWDITSPWPKLIVKPEAKAALLAYVGREVAEGRIDELERYRQDYRDNLGSDWNYVDDRIAELRRAVPEGEA
jgi:hypothetical protein